jgi:hypothetical protein
MKQCQDFIKRPKTSLQRNNDQNKKAKKRMKMQQQPIEDANKLRKLRQNSNNMKES